MALKRKAGVSMDDLEVSTLPEVQQKMHGVLKGLPAWVGWRVHIVPGDGNCFLHCTVDELVDRENARMSWLRRFAGGGKHGIQGVTELVECERCDDAWLREVQEEFRNGRLSVNNHAFLPGRLITFPQAGLFFHMENRQN